MRIIALEKFLPAERVCSTEIDQVLGEKEGFTEKLTGVAVRYRVSSGMTLAALGAGALQKALHAGNLTPGDIGLLLFTGASFDYPIPNTSTLIKSKITGDAHDFPCIDIDATCLSFLNGLDIAHLYLQSGRFQRVALVSAEISSLGLCPEDKKTYGLFGDAAVAVILENQPSYEVVYTRFVNYPSGVMLANLAIGGVVNRGRFEASDSRGYFFQMDGKRLIRLTTTHLEPLLEEVEAHTGCRICEFDAVITHQTSKFGNEYFLKKYHLDPARTIQTLAEFGNCISASLPLGLETYFSAHRPHGSGARVLLVGAAAGVSLGAMVLEFKPD